MSDKIRIGDVSSAVQDILDRYGDFAREALDDIVPQLAKDTVKKIRENIQTAGIGHGKKGDYAKGWKTKETKDVFGHIKAIAYNAKKPGLPHLLEFGHATRNGGRTKAYEHLEPAEEWAKNEAEKRVRREFEGGYY